MDKIIKFLLHSIRTGNIVRSIAGYLETRVKLLKLDIRNEIARALTLACMLMVLILMFFLVLLFSSMAVAESINAAYRTTYGGAIAIACFYLVVSGILFLYRKKVLAYFDRKIRAHTRDIPFD